MCISVGNRRNLHIGEDSLDEDFGDFLVLEVMGRDARERKRGLWERKMVMMEDFTIKNEVEFFFYTNDNENISKSCAQMNINFSNK